MMAKGDDQCQQEEQLRHVLVSPVLVLHLNFAGPVTLADRENKLFYCLKKRRKSHTPFFLFCLFLVFVVYIFSGLVFLFTFSFLDVFFFLFIY